MSAENPIIMYHTQDGRTRIEVRVQEESVWLSQAQMVELFQSSKANISEHIKNVLTEGELEEVATVRDFRTVQTEGSRSVQCDITHYNLDVIIAVGYRVKSLRGTQFRIWATQLLREYIIKGFTMNDALLKEAGGGLYWKELLQRIRDIRSAFLRLFPVILSTRSVILSAAKDLLPHCKRCFAALNMTTCVGRANL
jgi:hypothetical protein